MALLRDPGLCWSWCWGDAEGIQASSFSMECWSRSGAWMGGWMQVGDGAVSHLAGVE